MLTIPCFHNHEPGKVNLSKQMACSSSMDHVCWMYETDEEHRTVLTDFVKEGFQNNEKVVIVHALHTKEQILDYFADINIQKYILSGQLCFAHVMEVYFLPEEGFIPEKVIGRFAKQIDEAITEGYTKLRVYGDMSFVATADRKTFHKYETDLINLYAKYHRNLIGLCGYPSFVFEGSFITTMMTTHPKLYIGTELFESNFYFVPDVHNKPMKTVAEYWISNLREQKALQKSLQQKNNDICRMTSLLKGEIEERERAQIAKQLAEDANKNKRAFIATLSHEIRTPLFGILSTAALLRDTPLKGEQEEYVTMIDAIGEHLMTVLNDVLDYSKFESSKIELEQKPLSVRECVTTVVEMFRKKDTSKVTLDFHIPDQVPPHVLGDITRLRQILLNLVGNAFKFTPKGTVIVSVDCEEATNGTLQLYFSVQDNGVGIPKEQFGKIFTDYQQAGASVTRIFGGTGLGLAISKKLVEAMNGTIWFESQVGVGTTFFFTIMVKATDIPADSKRKRPLECTQTPLRILVAEDNSVNQAIMEKMLKKLGHTVEVVLTGFDAVEMTKKQRFDLILMDLHMPVMSGFEATQIIRKMSDPPRIVAVTAAVFEEERARCEEAGMDGFVTKPLKIEDLHHVCQETSCKHPRTT